MYLFTSQRSVRLFLAFPVLGLIPRKIRDKKLDGRIYSIAAKRFSENSLSPLYLKGHNDFFDGHRTSPAMPFGPPP